MMSRSRTNISRRRIGPNGRLIGSNGKKNWLLSGSGFRFVGNLMRVLGGWAAVVTAGPEADALYDPKEGYYR